MSPIYEFQCDNCECGYSYQAFVKINNEADKKLVENTICAVCNKGKFKKLISAPGGFNLKGGGFYKNGFNK